MDRVCELKNKYRRHSTLPVPFVHPTNCCYDIPVDVTNEHYKKYVKSPTYWGAGLRYSGFFR